MTHRFSSPFGLTVDVMSSSLSPIGHPAPAISKTPSNLKKARPHRGPPPPEPQSSQPENKAALPNERHHVDPNTRPQKDASPPEPEPDASVGGSSHHSPRPLVGNHVEPSSSGNRPSHAEGTTGQTKNVRPTRKPQDMGSDTSFGLQKTEASEGNIKPPVPQIHAPHAERVDLTTIVQPSAKPPTHPASPSGLPGVSTSPSASHEATAMTKTPSNRMPTYRGMPVGETHMVRSVPSIFLRAPDEGKGKSDSNPDEQNHSNRSTASLRPALPAENVIAKAGSPSPHQPGSGPHLLLRENSRNREHQGVDGKATRAPEPPTSEIDGKQTTALEERELETSATGPYTLRPTSLSIYTRHLQTHPLNPVERTNSSSISHSDSGYGSLPDISTSESQVGHSSDSAPFLARTGSSISPSPTLSTTQSQSEHITRGLPTNHSTASSADHLPPPSNVTADSQIQTAPTISHVSTVTPGSQDGSPITRTLRKTDDDTSSRLLGSGGGYGGQTRILSRPQFDPIHKTDKNHLLAKPSDRKVFIQPFSE